MGKTTAQKEANVVKEGIRHKDAYATAVGDITKAYFQGKNMGQNSSKGPPLVKINGLTAKLQEEEIHEPEGILAAFDCLADEAACPVEIGSLFFFDPTKTAWSCQYKIKLQGHKLQVYYSSTTI